ncbi:hypothetical protein AGMMS49990_03750 [Endomicrobiia bacterium]|nr:hypothetical protein AGMMS49990_03750 [Endomicrobiia bacterium]
MKKKKIISAIILFGLALSSCDKKNASLVNRRRATPEKIEEKEKFISEAQAAFDAAEKANESVINSFLHASLFKDLEIYAETLDKLALILDRGKSKNWQFRASKINGVELSSPEGCRAEARRVRGAVTEKARTMFETEFRSGLRVADEVLITPTRPSTNQCPICQEPEETLRNPRECPHCKKQVCRYCAAECIQKNNTCPLCRALL